MISLQSVSTTFSTRGGPVTGLDDVTLEIPAGQLACVVGPSGSGKTTLLMAIGGMLRPNVGTVQVNGQDVYSMSGSARAAFRARNIGFIFQMFHLVPYLNVLDNVLLCTHGNGGTSKQAAVELLERLGLSHRAGHKPSQLSTGERQRTAIARATLLKPSVLLADEPTGNLDEENAAEVVKILGNYRDEGGTVLVVTHGSDALEYADRVIRMRAGRVTEETITADSS